MSKTIHFYCGGTKPVLELLVAVHTLREHYSGNITICLGKTSVPYIYDTLKSSRYDLELIEVPDSQFDIKVDQHWSSRWRGMTQIKQDRVLHLDCDIIVKKPIDHCFDHIHPDPTFMTTFYLWNDGEDYQLWKEHLGIFKSIDKSLSEDSKPLYLGFGLIGFHNTWPHFNEMSELCLKIFKDELCMNYVLLHNGRKGYKPNIRNPIKTARAYYRLPVEEFDQTEIWHFSGGGPLGYHMWWKELIKMKEQNVFGLSDDKLLYRLNHRAFKKLKTNTWPSVDFKGKG